MLTAVSAGLCISVVYLFVCAITGDRIVALLTALFHIASSHVMFLAIVNDDIMPSYTVMFAAMALAAIWFAKPSALRVIAVSILFSVGWLFEWQQMFPTLPAMFVAVERHLEDLRRQIDRALELGYDVMVVRLWDITSAQLQTETGMVADSARLGAL